MRANGRLSADWVGGEGGGFKNSERWGGGAHDTAVTVFPAHCGTTLSAATMTLGASARHFLFLRAHASVFARDRGFIGRVCCRCPGAGGGGVAQWSGLDCTPGAMLLVET